MIRSALLQVRVPHALSHVGPGYATFTSSFRLSTAQAPDGGVHSQAAESPYGWSLLDATPGKSALTGWRAAEAVMAKIAVGRCIASVDAATLELGTVAREGLRAKLHGIGEWVLAHHDGSRASLEHFATTQLHRVRRQYLQRIGGRRLWLELRDERQRQAAFHDPGVRGAYLEWWRKRIWLLQSRFWWRVPGLSADDLAGELLVQLIVAVDSGDSTPFVVGGSPGIEGTFSFLVKKKNWLRRRRQIREVVTHDGVVAMHDRTPSGEELLMAKERRAEARRVMDDTSERLSATRRRYLEALLEDAESHGFVSEVRVARRLGVHKSSVSRALKVILATLRKVGATEVLEGLRLGVPRAKRRNWRPPEEGGRRPVILMAASEPDPPPPQPPWLDVGDWIALRDTGESGMVVGVDHCIVGALYRVRVGVVERADLPREALDYRTRIEVPF